MSLRIRWKRFILGSFDIKTDKRGEPLPPRTAGYADTIDELNKEIEALNDTIVRERKEKDELRDEIKRLDKLLTSCNKKLTQYEFSQIYYNSVGEKQ